MTNGVLYFPYMRVPSDAWFTRVLLYWDRIGAIMPPSYRQDRKSIGDYTVDLLNEGLLTAISPDERDIPDLAAGFDSVLEAADLGSSRPRVKSGHSEGAETRVHISKMGLPLARRLEDRGLARPAGGRDGGTGTSWTQSWRTCSWPI